jgi:hypothetical protein
MLDLINTRSPPQHSSKMLWNKQKKDSQTIGIMSRKAFNTNNQIKIKLKVDISLLNRTYRTHAILQ